MTLRRTPRTPSSCALSGTVRYVLTALLCIGGLSAAAQGSPPMVTDPVPDAQLRVGYDVYRLNFEDHFSRHVECFAASSDESVARVILQGLRVRVVPVGAGTATITLGASNAGGRTDLTFQVTVTYPPPGIGGPLSDVELEIGESVVIDVSDAFTGRVEDMTAMTSSDAHATVSLERTLPREGPWQSRLTLTAIAAAEVTVSLVATNGGGSTERTFTLTIPDHSPMLGEPLEPVSMYVDDTETVDLADAFVGNALAYSASSSAEDTATVSVDGTTLTLMGHAAGSAAVTVTATNSAGSVSQELQVTVMDVPPEAAKMLPDIEVRVGDSMTVDITGAFSGTALEYSAMSSAEDMATVSLDGLSLTVTGVAAGPATVTVTAMNSSDSAYQMFQVTVRDVAPGTVGALPDVSLVVGGAPETMDLAQYFSGSALVYGALGTGEAVSVSLAGSQVTVTPAIEGVATVTVTASNTEGSVTTSFSATVTTDVAEAEAIERGLAAIGAATISSVQSAFGARFRGPGAAIPVRESALAPYSADAPGAHVSAYGPVGGQWNQPGWNPQGAGAWNGQGWDNAGWQSGLLADDWNDLRRRHPSGAGMSLPMGGNSFIMPLSAAGGSGGGIGGFALWGHADQQSFEGDGIDGDLTSVYVGADMMVGDDLLVGLAASQSDGDVDYRFASAAASGTGTLSTEMMTLFPYAKWDVDLCTDLWVILGFGSGELESTRSAVARTSVADLTMSMVSAGASRVVASGEDWSIMLLGDVASLQMDTDGITGAIANVEVDVSRVRAAVEGKRTFAMDDGTRVILFGQLGARSDSGDGDTGQGAEVSAGVRYNTAGRFSFEVMGRFLANHSEDDVEESAFSVSAMLRPMADGSGLSVALSSRLGRDFDLAGMLQGVDYDYVRQMRGSDVDDWGFDARVGYGLSPAGLPGVLTPFAQMDLRSEDRRGARLGVRLDAGGSLVEHLSVEMSAGRAYHFYDDTMAGLVELRGELRF